jgi:hypothetical protein
MGSIVELGMWGHHKVGVPISARVLKWTPRVGGTYLGVFTVHSAANISSDANGQF